MKKKIAIIIPAYNEGRTIKEVILSFARQDLGAEIYVVDNASTDGTSEIAERTLRECGVIGKVLSEPRKGKAMAIKKAFTVVDADVYVMVDGDSTYPANEIKKLVAPVANGMADMVVGDRLTHGDYAKENKRLFHEGGNNFVRWIICRLYGCQLHDILSGYRVFSRRFVKTYPVLCDGFELEADLTLHALDKRMSLTEIPIEYKDRPEGSVSKLNTIKDGMRILGLIFNIFRFYRPLCFFGSISALIFIVGLGAGSLPILDYIKHQYVYHLPLAVLAASLIVLSILFASMGLILDGMARSHRFAFELNLLRISKDGISHETV